MKLTSPDGTHVIHTDNDGARNALRALGYTEEAPPPPPPRPRRRRNAPPPEQE